MSAGVLPPEVRNSLTRSVRVDPTSLAAEVRAIGALRQRVVAALEASGIALHKNGDSSPARVRIVAEDLARHVAVGPLRARLGADRDCAVLVVSPECSPLSAARAIRAGADAVIVASDLEETLAPAVRAVAAGLSALPVPVRNAADRPALSYREREVLRRAVAGKTNSEIAKGMFLAQSTVKSHLSSAYRKLGAGGRKEAASLILDPDEGLLEVVFGTQPTGTRTADVQDPRAGRALPERTALLAHPFSSRDAGRIRVS
jgi:DNA-binding CsgD family transcriptional regulator